MMTAVQCRKKPGRLAVLSQEGDTIGLLLTLNFAMFLLIFKILVLLDTLILM